MDIKDIEKNVDVAVNLLKALSNEKRLLIICTLYQGERSVTEPSDFERIGPTWAWKPWPIAAFLPS